MKSRYCTIASTLLFLLSFAGCGKFSRLENGEYTQVTIRRESPHGLSASAVMAGGIMVYAYSQDYARNGMLNDETGQLSFSLPNGTYSFYAFGYSVAFNNAGSDNGIRCAVVPSVQLTGQAQDINITLQQSTCTHGAFTGDGAFTSAISAATIFPVIQVVHCGTAAGTNLGTIASSQDCSTTPTTGITAAWPNAGKYQVKFPIYERVGNGFNRLSDGIVSACNDGNASTSGAVGANEFKRVPVGSTNLPFLIPVEFYTYSTATNACTATAPIAQHRFHRSLVFGPDPDPAPSAKALYNSGFTRIFLREP